MRLHGVLLAGALALSLPLAGATRVVTAPHVAVLYDDPSEAAYAQHVARVAEAELLQVAGLFGRAPFPVRVRLQAGDDLFNAFALPLPRPHVTFRPLFPLDGALGFHSPDLVATVLRHELTHLVQLTDTREPAGRTGLPDVGIAGQRTAVLPPAWLLEGIATWVESNGGSGGRLNAAQTRALLWTLAADGKMPSLADVSLVTYQAWPGGRARYLLGASFIDRLVREHGFGALLGALRVFQGGHYLMPFAAAWKRAVGTELSAEWRAWTETLSEQARSHTGLRVAAGLAPSGDDEGAAALGPDGRTLAWRVQDGVRFARLEGGKLTAARTMSTPVTPEAITWSGPNRLVMAAVARTAEALPSDLFALNVETGTLTRLTRGAHAHLPRAAGDGCVIYVRDVVPDGASLRRWCPDGADEPVWRAPSGVHVVGLAVSAAGRVAASLYRAGQVDLAFIGRDGARYLTHDDASELDPAWQGEDALLFASDASGLFQLRRLAVRADGAVAAAAAAPDGAGTQDLTSALGGATQPVWTGTGTVYRTLRGDGYALAWLDAAPRDGAQGAGPRAAQPQAASPPSGPARPAAAGTGGRAGAGSSPSGPRYPDLPYSPWPSLLPYGWLPSGGRLSLKPAGAGLQVTALGLDDSARHALDLTVGYDTGLNGALAGAYGWLRYAWNMPDIARAHGPPPVLGMAFEAGAWPHGPYLGAVDEVAYGVTAEALLRAPVGAYAGSFDVAASLLRAPSLPGWRPEVRVDASLDGLSGDAFGAVSGGSTVALHGRLSYGAAGASSGAWVDAATYPGIPGLAVVWRLAARVGYRPTPPMPVALPQLAGTLSLGGRVSVPLRWREADGLFALERLDIVPTARLWGGTDPVGGGWSAMIGAGGDLALWADTVLDYDALARFGVRVGYAQGWWLGVGASVPY